MKRTLPTQSPTTSSKSKLTTPPKQSPSSKKFRSAGQAAGHTSTTNPTMLGESRFNPSNPQTNESTTPYPLPPFQMKTSTQTTSTHDNDRSSVSDNDSVHSPHERNVPADDEKPKPAPGKKTRGRVKIEMQYIQNKLRRYTTFSKRKSGIMKKAYELSTLTGTQVMLLVASETGHVYTFATPKLQPMITSEAGKALIQTCLHTPEHSQAVTEYDMRMSVSGYEETDLGYSMNEDDGYKPGIDVSGHLVTSAGPMPPHMMNNQVVAIPHGLVQMPFATEAQTLNAIMGPPISHPMPTSCVSPITHSPPPSYSPAHPTSPPRTYPASPPYSQGSHMPAHQQIMMDDLATSSPMRKSPDGHYLSHPTFDGSPSHSPMTGGQHFSVRTPPQGTMYSHHTSSSPLGQHSPMGTM